MKLTGNLKFLRERLGFNKTEMTAEFENISDKRWGNYENGTREPDMETLIDFSDYFKIPVDALLKADLSKAKLDGIMLIGETRTLFPILVDKDNNDVIEVIPVKSAAGYLKGHTDPQYFEKLQTMKLPFKVIGKHRAFPIIGDSMPPAKEGSFVIGKFVESFDDIESGGTYIVLTNEGPVYKRVHRKSKSLELHSDNPIYKPYEIAQDKVYEVWQFVCCINLTDQKEDEINMNSLMAMMKDLKIQIENKNY